MPGHARPLDLFRRLQPIDLHHAFGHLALAVQRRSAYRKLDRFVNGLPLVGGQRRLQSGIPNCDRLVRGSRFTSCVRHVRIDAEMENRFVLLGHGQVGLGRECDGKRTVRCSRCRSVVDFLAGVLRHAPPIEPAAPGREANFAHDAVPYIGAVDRGAGVSRRRAFHGHFRVQLGRCSRLVHRDLELRPLVFFDVEIGRTARFALDANGHAARHTVSRCREATAERTIVVRTMLLSRDFLVIPIGEDHRQRTIGERFVVVGLLVDVDAQTFVLNGLTRPVKRAVGEENRASKRACFHVPLVSAIVLRRRQLLALGSHDE